MTHWFSFFLLIIGGGPGGPGGFHGAGGYPGGFDPNDIFSQFFGGGFRGGAGAGGFGGAAGAGGDPFRNAPGDDLQVSSPQKRKLYL